MHVKVIFGRTFIFILTIVMVLSLFSCDFDESDKHLSGGILLDDGLMSEIEYEIFNGETVTLKIEETEISEENAGSSDSIATDTEETIDWDKYSDKVYWTKSGTVFHVSEKCQSLKNSTNIQSGSVSEAKESGKERSCSKCSK